MLNIISELRRLGHEAEGYGALHKIKDPVQRRVVRRAYAEWDELEKTAKILFGEINGWTHVPSQFKPKSIGRTQRRDYDYTCVDWMDHPLHYRTPPLLGHRFGRNIAIVGQPYGGIERYQDELNRTADAYDLRWHIPPVPRASFHNPGSTLFIVLTIADHEVKWLPEQIASNIVHGNKVVADADRQWLESARVA